MLASLLCTAHSLPCFTARSAAGSFCPALPRTQPLFSWICKCQQVGRGVGREGLPGCSKGPSVWAGNVQSQPTTPEHLSASSPSPTAKVTHHRRASCARHQFNTKHPSSSLWGHTSVVFSHFKNTKSCLIESWRALPLLPAQEVLLGPVRCLFDETSPCGCRTPLHTAVVHTVCSACINLGIINFGIIRAARFPNNNIEARSLILLTHYQSHTYKPTE